MLFMKRLFQKIIYSQIIKWMIKKYEGKNLEPSILKEVLKLWKSEDRKVGQR